MNIVEIRFCVCTQVIRVPVHGRVLSYLSLYQSRDSGDWSCFFFIFINHFISRILGLC